jgi:hypothetical protein
VGVLWCLAAAAAERPCLQEEVEEGLEGALLALGEEVAETDQIRWKESHPSSFDTRNEARAEIRDLITR